MQTKPSACKCLKVKTETRAASQISSGVRAPSESAVSLLSLCLLPVSAPPRPRLHQRSTPGRFRFPAARLESAFAEINFTSLVYFSLSFRKRFLQRAMSRFLSSWPICSFTPARCILRDSTVTPEDGCSGILFDKNQSLLFFY